ncbi:SDR family NAD(P)-dependent oxidoreductase [Sansalvadorimonas sp. 2012CJ34-2]|uniref:SDR family NAD(P)-dependent oxidoreductase n=1 Tax=Parendozoicomonas callyspongiae TaxID=2942213 RepID=A0ABT0PFU7_9GAMM|nr:SDR family NAD(P)-dependent oxidoreductase [Sansalvadorimonas sp. 2012CJ34-2]MCL6270225.1 SDR family NAD(P)-dependent oxidoreductase [Sansalvadorimonas sp. 2012CJ34-2]
MRTLEGKVVALTGAGSGIGRALAIMLSKAECKLALADINPESLKDTCELLPEDTESYCQAIDVSDPDQVQNFADTTAEHFGQVDIIINNAGVFLSQSIADLSIKEMKWLMDINFWGIVYGCKSFLPYLQKQNDAHIVNISSIFGLVTTPNQSAYCASKFAVRGFTETLRQETKHTGIHVSCVIPGGIKTNIVRNGRFFTGPNEDSTRDKAAQRFEEMATISPERAAQVIINGILSNRKRIFIGPDTRLIDIASRLLPVRCEAILGKGLKGVLN